MLLQMLYMTNDVVSLTATEFHQVEKLLRMRILPVIGMQMVAL